MTNNLPLSEMGHALHDILSKTRYARFHGYETTLDFVEMPSSLLENWCWKKDVLKKLGCHYSTLDEKYLFEWRKQNPGQPDPPKEVPDHWVNKLAEHRYFNRALFHLRQLYVPPILNPCLQNLTIGETLGQSRCSIFKYTP
jgi:metallopeptidase MepB